MEAKSGGLDHWRDYFRTANSDIFEIIERAIKVAALDCPKEFKLRRDGIAEVLYTCRLTRFVGCDRVEVAVGEDDDRENGGFKESKVNSSRDDESGEMNVNQLMSNYSYGEAEALTNEIEEEREVLGEALRIKEILQNSDESDSVLFESLRRLQLMALNVDILKATEIGKAVNGLRRHSSKQIRHLTRELIDGWKAIVDEWVKATSEIAEGTPDSINPSVLDEEEGLPSPPLDDGVFFATQTMELSQFFDGMDDDGNPRNNGELSKNQKEQPNKDNKGQQIKKQQTFPKPNKVSNTQSGPGRPIKINSERRTSNESKVQQKPNKPTIQKRPVNRVERLRHSEEEAVQEKIEATKRKLQERYQQAENAKRQRTIQVMELHDLPKQGLGKKNTHGKFGNFNRHWTNGRR